MNITKDTIIGDIITFDEDSAGIFIKNGMHCIGCPASLNESIEQASYVHGIDPTVLVQEINKIVAADQAPEA